MVKFGYGKLLLYTERTSNETARFAYGNVISNFEYVAPAGGTILPIIDHHYQLMGMM